VAPNFYTRTSDGIPVAWCEMMRNSIKDLVPRFSSHRMVTDYYERFYRQSSDRYRALSAQSFTPATEQAAWCSKLMTSWQDIQVFDLASDAGEIKTVGQKVAISVKVRLGALSPDDVTVEAYYGPMDHQGDFTDRETLLMVRAGDAEPGVHVFEGRIGCNRPGRFGYTVRVTPSRGRLGNPFVLGLVTWA
jgi:starch phosphorylase